MTPSKEKKHMDFFFEVLRNVLQIKCNDLYKSLRNARYLCEKNLQENRSVKLENCT